MLFQDLKHQRHHFSIHWQNQKSPSKMKNNVLLSGCTNDSLKSLQLILTHTLTRTKQYEHVSPVLASLHWIPVKSRIDFKVLLLTYKALNDLAPNYLKELVVPYCPLRPLRSQSAGLLVIPRI